MKMAHIKLGELVTLRKGRKAPEVYDSQINGAKRYLQISDLREEGEPRFAVDPKGVLSNEKDVIIAWDGANAGTVGFGLEGYIGSTLTVLHLTFDKVDTAYLGRFLQSHFRYLNQLTTGATIPHIDRTRLEGILVPLPPISEQCRIAAILDKADAIRRKRQEARRLTEEFIRSAFLDMFGDPVTNPKGWPVKKLGQLLNFLTSGSRGWAKYYSQQGSIFLRIQNVGRNQLLLNEMTYVNPPDSAEARRTRVQDDDVLLSITADLGRTGVVPPGLGPAYINQHLAILRVNGIEPIYLSAFLAGAAGQRQFKVMNREGVKAGLNFDNIQSVKVIVPPKHLQRRFVKLYHKQGKALGSHSTIVEEDSRLFNSLVQRAFRGELKSTEAELD